MKQHTKWFQWFALITMACLGWLGWTSIALTRNVMTEPFKTIGSPHLADGLLSSGRSGVSRLSVASLPHTLSIGGDDDQLVLGGNFTLQSGKIMDGSLVVIGGNALIEENATVNGDIVMVGGHLSMDGVVTGEIFILGGSGELGATATVRGDVSTFAGDLSRSPEARIEGKVRENSTTTPPAPSFSLPARPTELSKVVVNNRFSIWDGIFFLFRSFMWAAVAIIVVLFFPKNTKRITDAVVSNSIVAGGLGLLTAVAAPVFLVIIAFTIIGIPISLLAALVLAVTWAFGIVAIGVETGARIGRVANQEWALPVSAGIGTFLLTLVVNGIGEVVPCVGWLAPFMVGCVGLGATLLTVFGTRQYPNTIPARSYSVSAQPSHPHEQPIPATHKETAENELSHQTSTPDETKPQE